MPGAGAYRFNFDSKEPLVVRGLTILLFANTFLGLGLDFGAQYFLPKASVNLPPCEALTKAGVQYYAPALVCWFAERFIPIQFILLVLIGTTFVIFRERVRYIPPRSRPSSPLMIAWLGLLVSIIIWVTLSQLGWLR